MQDNLKIVNVTVKPRLSGPRGDIWVEHPEEGSVCFDGGILAAAAARQIVGTDVRKTVDSDGRTWWSFVIEAKVQRLDVYGSSDAKAGVAVAGLFYRLYITESELIDRVALRVGERIRLRVAVSDDSDYFLVAIED